MINLGSDLKGLICIHILESYWFVLEIILDCVNVGNMQIGFSFILLYTILGERKKKRKTELPATSEERVSFTKHTYSYL